VLPYEDLFYKGSQLVRTIMSYFDESGKFQDHSVVTRRITGEYEEFSKSYPACTDCCGSAGLFCESSHKVGCVGCSILLGCGRGGILLSKKSVKEEFRQRITMNDGIMAIPMFVQFRRSYWSRRRDGRLLRGMARLPLSKWFAVFDYEGGTSA
jgi:hypothetical protein